MLSSSSLEMKKPKVVIFLDLDGVFNRNMYESDGIIDRLVKEQFNTCHQNTQCNGCLKCRKIKSQLFDKEALQAFNALIEKISVYATPHIVISSNWRKRYSVDQLKSILSDHEFSKLIVGKTTEQHPYLNDLDEWKMYCNCKHLSLQELGKIRDENDGFLDMKMYMQASVRCRASEVNEWIQTHSKYDAYLVIDDDIKSHLKENFDNKFICTLHGESETDALFTKEDEHAAFAVFLQSLGKENEVNSR